MTQRTAPKHARTPETSSTSRRPTAPEGAGAHRAGSGPAHRRADARPSRKPKRHDAASIAIDALITIAILAILFGVGSLKAGFFIDEVCTFLLSNHQYSLSDSIAFSVEDGSLYDGEDLWNEYTAVADGTGFDYANVWANQAADVHPPLYYLLIHTVCSLFPQLSVLQLGLLVNVPIACIVYWQLVWICERLGMRKWMARCIAAAFVLSVGFMNASVLTFRMYGLFSLWVNCLVMVFMKHGPEQQGSASYYLAFGLSLLGGMLTQHYFLIYALFACLVYAVAVVVAKNWRKLFASLGVAALSFAASLLIFPATLYHLFGSSRGREAFANAGAAGGVLDALQEYAHVLNKNFFGGLFPAVIVAFVILGAIAIAVYAYRKSHRAQALAQGRGLGLAAYRMGAESRPARQDGYAGRYASTRPGTRTIPADGAYPQTGSAAAASAANLSPKRAGNAPAGSENARDTSEEKSSHRVLHYLLLVLPGLLYILVLAKIAPAQLLRYVIAVCGPLYLAVFGLMGELTVRIPKRSFANACVIVLVGILLLSGYQNGITCLYLDETATRDFIEENEDSASVILYSEDYTYNVEEYLWEIDAMDRVVFFNSGDWEGFDYASLDCDSLIVVVDEDFAGDGDAALAKIMDDIGATTCEKKFSVVRGVLYYLY